VQFAVPAADVLAMSRDEFDALVRRLEPFAQKHPRAYVLRVVLLALLGYAFFFVILGCLVAALSGLVALMIFYPSVGTVKLGLVFGIVLLAFMGAVLRPLWVRIDAPEGFEVHRAGTKDLFAVLDGISAELRCRRFHHVIMTTDYNASVIQVPRLGVFGWQRNFLIIGLPLMQSLSPDQFRAVMAHEFAHLSGNHSRFGCWIYRVRKSWEQALIRLQMEQHFGAPLFLKFFQWYSPYFNAYTFVLARSNEYEADACAERLAGAETFAHALMKVKIHSRLIDESFWPAVHRLAGREAVPPAGVFAQLGDMLHTGPTPATTGKWLHQSLLGETSTADTHPCLRDRLAAIGFAPVNGPLESVAPPPAASVSAATQLLGDALPVCTRALEMRWEGGMKTTWRDRYIRAEKDRDRLDELKKFERDRVLTVDEHYDRARIVLDLDGETEATPLLRRVLEMSPDHIRASFMLGRVLLDDDDASGVTFLEKSMTDDPDAFMAGCNALHAYYRRTGQRERVREIEKRHDDQEGTLRTAELERQSVSITDSFLPHGLDDAQAEDIRIQLAGYADISRAWLVRKQVAMFPKKPLYVLVAECRGSCGLLEVSAAGGRLMESLADNLRLPGQTFIFVPEGGMEPVARLIRIEPWTLFYDRSAPVVIKSAATSALPFNGKAA